MHSECGRICRVAVREGDLIRGGLLYLSGNITKIKNKLDSHIVSELHAQDDSFSGVTLSTFQPVT